MTVEDRLRATTDALSGAVREVRPLTLPSERPGRVSGPSELRRGRGWMAPVTAAAVVVALAITVVSLREVRNEPPVSPVSSAPAGSGATPAAAVPPTYYAALDDPSGTAFNDQKTTHVVDVVVGDAGTGRRIASVAPPKGQTFAGLTAAADDRTFVVAASSFPVPQGLFSTAPVAWYLLRIAPGAADAAKLSKLRIPGQPTGTQVSGIALSPDGSELAVLYQRGVWGIADNEGPLTLSVYSVSTGKALRTWTQSTSFPAGFGWYWGRYSNSSITWLANGAAIAFTDGNLSGENGPPLGGAFSGVKIRTLDLARPSGDLIADSKVVFTSGNHWCSTLQLAPDGKSVFCGSYGGNAAKNSSAYDPEILQYSVATGKSRLVYRLKGAYNLGLANVLWMNSGGSALFVSVLAQTSVHGQGGYGVGSVGLLAKGTIKQISLLVSDPFAGEIAF